MVQTLFTILLFGYAKNLFACESGNNDDPSTSHYFYEAENTMEHINLKCNHQKQMNLYRSSMSHGSTACEPGSVRRTRCVKPIVGDGNCLFRAISYLLYGDENHHARVRKEIVAYVVENWDEYKSFMAADTYAKVASPRDYEAYMGANQTWGDEIEVSAATHVYHLCLHIYTNRSFFYRTGQEYSKTGALLHTNGHYRVVEDVFESCEPKKRKHSTNRWPSFRNLFKKQRVVY